MIGCKSNPPQTVLTDDGEVWSSSTKIDGQRVVIALFYGAEDADAVWNVALLVGATRKAKKGVRQAALWGRKYTGRSTGRVGLRALKWAMDQIDLFQAEYPEATVVVGWEDDKRRKAYAAVRRYGFKIGRYRGEQVYFRAAEDFEARPRTRRNPMSRCPISGKFVARDNPRTPTVTKPSGEEVVFCCPSHKKQYLRGNPVKYRKNPEPGGVTPTAAELLYAMHEVLSEPKYRDKIGPRFSASPWLLDGKTRSVYSTAGYLQHLADSTSLTREDMGPLTQEALTHWREKLGREVRFRDYLNDVEDWASFADRADRNRQHIGRAQLDYLQDDEEEQVFLRQRTVLKRLGFFMLPRWQHGEQTKWVCLAPPQRLDLCEHKLISFDQHGEAMRLYVKHPEVWADVARYPHPQPDPEFHPWMLLAQKHDVRAFPTYFVTGKRAAVETWLRRHKPSRKALERKLKKFVESIPSEHDFSDHPLPEWVSASGGRHIRDENELRRVGRKNGWCFGSTHYASFLDDIVNRRMFIYLIPHRQGLIALSLRGGDSPAKMQSKIEFPNDSEATYTFSEAKFPRNVDATRVAKQLWLGWVRNRHRGVVPDQETTYKKRRTRRDTKKGGTRYGRERYARRKGGSRKNPGAVDPQGRYIPEKYLAGLPPELREARVRELGESRSEYGTGDFSELPTDRAARKMGLVKLSAYRVVAQRRGFDISQVSDMKDMATKALRYYGAKTTASVVNNLAAGLDKVYAKGLAAWKSGGHRPGARQTSWGDARVASVLVAGKAAWTADSKQFNMLPAKAQQAAIKQLPELYKALAAQGRQRDIDYIERASGMAARDNGKKGMSPAMRAFLRGEKNQRSRSEAAKMRYVEQENERIAKLMREKRQRGQPPEPGQADLSRYLKRGRGKKRASSRQRERNFIKVVVRAIVPGKGTITEEIYIYSPGRNPPKLEFRALAHNAFDVLNPEPRARAHAIKSTARVSRIPADDPEAVFNIDLSQYTVQGAKAEDNPSWADIKRGFTRAGKSAKKTAAYAKKRARLNAKLSKARKAEAKSRSDMDYLMKCMNRLHVRAGDLGPEGRGVVRSFQESVQRAAKNTAEAQMELRSFLKARRNPPSVDPRIMDLLTSRDPAFSAQGAELARVMGMSDKQIISALDADTLGLMIMDATSANPGGADEEDVALTMYGEIFEMAKRLPDEHVYFDMLDRLDEHQARGRFVTIHTALDDMLTHLNATEKQMRGVLLRAAKQQRVAVLPGGRHGL